jgi:MoxR-like ATPase
MQQVHEFTSQVVENVERVIVGKRDVIELLMVALLCEGHVLLEDVPGTGKTMLARSIAISLGGSFKRLQCTPDLLPNDVTGVSVFNQQTAEFEFRKGPIFVNILLADEINRATPRTQSALLEAMQEQQVTVDGVTRPLPRPFLVLATQNPIEYEGTFPLPEAQLDRFLMRLSV